MVFLWALAAVIAGIGVLAWQLARTADRLHDFDPETFEPQMIAAHTFKPAGGRVPPRGHLVAEAALRLARTHHCPIGFAAGQTIDGSQTESEVYARYVREELGGDVPIYTALDASARDTYGETQQLIALAHHHGLSRLLVIGHRPHLASRIGKFWSSASDLQVRFVGISGPWHYYLWEISMMVVEWTFPPTSNRRQRLLDVVRHRRGK